MNAKHSNGVAGGKRSLKLAAVRLLVIMNVKHSNGVAAGKRLLKYAQASWHGIEDKDENDIKQQEVTNYGYFILYGGTGCKDAAGTHECDFQ